MPVDPLPSTVLQRFSRDAQRTVVAKIVGELVQTLDHSNAAGAVEHNAIDTDEQCQWLLHVLGTGLALIHTGEYEIVRQCIQVYLAGNWNESRLDLLLMAHVRHGGAARQRAAGDPRAAR